jgi:beta-glucanase (GH16 family)
VNTLGRFSQAYGRFEVRAKFPTTAVAGLQSSLWMWPISNKYGSWPTNGEIDMAEEYSQYSDRAIPYVHYTSAINDTHVTNTYCTISIGAFHTYVVVWTTSTITVLFDGQTCISDTWQPAAPLVKPQPFDQPFMVALTQALGVGGNAVTDSTPLPATTQVDYVRVWS